MVAALAMETTRPAIRRGLHMLMALLALVVYCMKHHNRRTI
jgi:hypothetical protein